MTSFRSKVLTTTFYCVALLMWPAVTWAAAVTLGNTLNSIPPSALMIIFVLATVSGIVSLLQRLKDEMMKPEGETQIRRAWRWFAVAHLSGALFVGMIAFMIAEAANIKDFYEAVFIAVLAYAGARAMDRMADGVTDGVINRLVTLVGGAPPTNSKER
jgi:hypothetical protein